MNKIPASPRHARSVRRCSTGHSGPRSNPRLATKIVHQPSWFNADQYDQSNLIARGNISHQCSRYRRRQSNASPAAVKSP
jgi:hypothetical protein